MKIVLLTPAHPLRGGIAASSERLALEFQNLGHEVVLYSFSLQYPDFLFPGKTQRTTDPPPPGLQIRTLLNSVNPFNWIRVGRLIAQEKPACIVARFWLPFMGPCLGTVLRVARWVAPRKVRIVGLVDNLIPHEKRPGDRLFARYFTGACDEFVAMSRSVSEEIYQFCGKPARFAPHPVYDIYGSPMAKQSARQMLGLPAEKPMILFFGFIRPYKGLDLLLEALAQSPDVHAVIAGECYEDWASYDAIIQKHQLQERIHLFADFIPADQVRLYFSAADLVVQPYKTATQSGISQIAYHFDKPMVVTNVGGLPEIVPHGVAGYVVPPEPQALSEAIRDFFQNHREERLIAGVQQEKMKFSWKNLAEKTLEVFRIGD
jgi:glycosyltransferase involved in cell wall biosynthesis